MRIGHIILAIVVAASLSGCGDWPDPAVPGEEAARSAAFPELVPLSDILGRAPAGSGPGLLPAGRIAALSARAAALRGPVIDPATRARMDGGVDTGALSGAR